MGEPTVADVMTTDVVTVRPHTGVKDIVTALVSNEISAVPVVDDEGELVGLVSEADLLPKEEFRGGVDRPRLTERRSRSAWRKAPALLASEVMTRDVLTIAPTERVSAAAKRLAHSGVRRLLVVDDGRRLLGVLSRRDLLRVFLRTDEQLKNDILRDVFREVLCVDTSTVDVEVTDGFVTVLGVLERASEVRLADRLIRALPGVVGLRNGILSQFDDTTIVSPHY